jgi:hypothetical protein
MKDPHYLLTLALLVPATAGADPISVSGIWSSPTSSSARAGSPYWAGNSWDCATCGIGDLLNAFGTPNIEYLNDGAGNAVSFRFTDAIITSSLMFSITAWTGGTFGRREDGAFTYDSGTGRVSNSWDNPGQYALFRIVGPDTTRYFLGIEDILATEVPNDFDYNDYVVTFSTPTQPVPEPSALLLMGSALATFAHRARVRRKPASDVSRGRLLSPSAISDSRTLRGVQHCTPRQSSPSASV